MRNPEALLISSALINTDWNIAASKGVVHTMFHTYQEEWRWIELYKQRHRKLPTPRAFKEQFENFTFIKDVNDTAHFANEVKRNHAKQQLMAIVNDTVDNIQTGKIEDAIALTSNRIVQVASSIGTYRDTNIFDDYDDIMKDIEERVRRFESQGSSGIPTGIPTIDELTGGLQPGTFNIVAARLGSYKSWIMQYIAAQAVLAGYHVVFDALEQSRAEVAMRIHSLMSGIVCGNVFNSSHVMQGRVNIQAYRNLVKDLKDTVKGRLHVCDTSHGSIGSNLISAQAEKHNPDLICIDYLGLLDDGFSYEDMNRMSKNLKITAGNYGVPVLAAAQLNRTHGLSDGPAQAEALAGTDNFGRDADTIVTSARFKKKGRHVLICSLEKNRNGDTGLFYMHTNPGLGSFREISQNEAEELFQREQDEADARSVARRIK